MLYDDENFGEANCLIWDESKNRLLNDSSTTIVEELNIFLSQIKDLPKDHIFECGMYGIRVRKGRYIPVEIRFVAMDDIIYIGEWSSCEIIKHHAEEIDNSMEVLLEYIQYRILVDYT